MRNLLILIVLGVLGYLGYNYYNDHKAEIDQRIAALLNRGGAQSAAAPAASNPAEPAAPAPAPAPAPTFQSKIQIPEGVAGEKKLAPPGIFYMVDRISVTTATGVQAVNPGEEVKLLQRLPGNRMKVTIGPADFEVRENQVTNDLEVAQQAEKQTFTSKGGRL